MVISPISSSEGDLAPALCSVDARLVEVKTEARTALLANYIFRISRNMRDMQMVHGLTTPIWQRAGGDNQISKVPCDSEDRSALGRDWEENRGARSVPATHLLSRYAGSKYGSWQHMIEEGRSCLPRCPQAICSWDPRPCDDVLVIMRQRGGRSEEPLGKWEGRPGRCSILWSTYSRSNFRDGCAASLQLHLDAHRTARCGLFQRTESVLHCHQHTNQITMSRINIVNIL